MFKKNSIIFALFIALAISTVTHAGVVKGKIQYIRVHEPQHGEWAPPVFWFSLEGVNSHGTCKTWHGNVLLTAEHDYFFSMVLATQAQNAEIAVFIDPQKTGAGGFCRAVYLTTGNPPITR